MVVAAGEYVDREASPSVADDPLCSPVQGIRMTESLSRVDRPQYTKKDKNTGMLIILLAFVMYYLLRGMGLIASVVSIGLIVLGVLVYQDKVDILGSFAPVIDMDQHTIDKMSEYEKIRKLIEKQISLK